jgi:hypothetical protein
VFVHSCRSIIFFCVEIIRFEFKLIWIQIVCLNGYREEKKRRKEGERKEVQQPACSLFLGPAQRCSPLFPSRAFPLLLPHGPRRPSSSLFPPSGPSLSPFPPHGPRPDPSLFPAQRLSLVSPAAQPEPCSLSSSLPSPAWAVLAQRTAPPLSPPAQRSSLSLTNRARLSSPSSRAPPATAAPQHGRNPRSLPAATAPETPGLPFLSPVPSPGPISPSAASSKP